MTLSNLKSANGMLNLSILKESIPVLQKMPTVEVAEILLGLEAFQLIDVLLRFTPEQQGLIFSEFSASMQHDMFKGLSRKRFAQIFEHMPSDNRADLFQHLSPQEQAGLLPYLSKQVREDVIHLSSYPPETAGGIMSTDFATVSKSMTCQQAIQKVRKDAPSKRTVYYVYVVDDEMKLQGFVTLKDLIMAEPDEVVSGILHSEFTFAYVEEDREEVARKIEKYDLVAIPVLNKEDQLLGIVTHDEAIEIIRAEHTEDLEKFMGMMPGKDVMNYSDTSVWQHFRKRVVWIAGLAVVGLISGIIVHHFEDTISALLILALYMPMVADTGGNAGSQAATVVVRALALGQITTKSWLKVILKEARISLLLALVLGLIAFGKIMFLSWESEIPGQFNLLYIAMGISLALSLQVVTATVIGAGLPLVVKRFGGDPAVAASPAITTIVDITGLLIYFGIAVSMFF